MLLGLYVSSQGCQKSETSITVSWSRFKSKFPHAVICTVAQLTQSLKVKRKEMETVGVFFELQWKIQMNSWFFSSNVHILWTGPGVSGNSLTFPEAGPLEGALERRGAQKAQQGEETPHVYARISRQSPGPHTVTDCRSSGGQNVCAEPRSPAPSSSPTHHPRTRTMSPASSACGTRYCEIPARFFLLSTRYTEEILFSVKLKPLAREAHGPPSLKQLQLQLKRLGAFFSSSSFLLHNPPLCSSTQS